MNIIEAIEETLRHLVTEMPAGITISTKALGDLRDFIQREGRTDPLSTDLRWRGVPIYEIPSQETPLQVWHCRAALQLHLKRNYEHEQRKQETKSHDQPETRGPAEPGTPSPDCQDEGSRETGSASIFEAPKVAGRRIRTSNADFERACLVHIDRLMMEQGPYTSAMVDTFCEAVRLSREYSDMMQVR